VDWLAVVIAAGPKKKAPAQKVQLPKKAPKVLQAENVAISAGLLQELKALRGEVRQG
jgi:hypothetical protein